MHRVQLRPKATRRTHRSPYLNISPEAMLADSTERERERKRRNLRVGKLFFRRCCSFVLQQFSKRILVDALQVCYRGVYLQRPPVTLHHPRSRRHWPSKRTSTRARRCPARVADSHGTAASHPSAIRTRRRASRSFPHPLRLLALPVLLRMVGGRTPCYPSISSAGFLRHRRGGTTWSRATW